MKIRKSTIMPLSWHENCLRNSTYNLAREILELERLRKRCEQWAAENELYAQQIAAAKARNMDGFDRDKFLKPRRK